ncbi:putative GPI transamidase component PIG-T [Septoria linicola]|nr:putative GPI transamidase component PIG-T [Septoria linicola]
MKLSLLALPASLLHAVYAAALHNAADYSEHLHLKPLPAGSLYAGFNFTASTPLADYDNQHFRFFPRSLAQILQYTHTAELHLRFALGRWDEESWGSRPRNGHREGGTGVELWAWMEASSRTEAEERWSGLVNSLSGLFCASLNFIDQSKTIKPILTFQPEGTLPPGNSSLHLMHGMLPHEVVCTENLTPFLKLLPCKGKAGVSSLLDGHKVFDANWQTMSIDVRPRCGVAGSDCSLDISQTVDMVLDLDRSMRPQDNPIPRPPPIEQIPCDETKAYNAQDTCYPKRLEGDMAWSLSRIFGRPIQGSCPLNSANDAAVVTLDVPTSRLVEVKPATSSHSDVNQSSKWRSYRLLENEDFDLDLPQQDVQHDYQQRTDLLRASRQITGYGQERGGMHTVIVNPHPTPQRIVYLESLPWYLRPYMHTLKITGATTEKMYYTPAIDRRKGTHLELLLNVPAFSTVELTYDFEKAILRYTEYPPDANRGFDVAPAIIRVLPDSENGEDSYLRTTSLLLPLPTPDFSMPYNVIILTSTVIALGFGSIFNLLIRRFVLLEEVPKAPLNGLLGKLRMKLDRLRGKSVAPVGAADSLAKDGVSGRSAITSGSAFDHDLGTLYSRRTGTRLATANGSTKDR